MIPKSGTRFSEKILRKKGQRSTITFAPTFTRL
jgi:hypothetical protein